MKMRVISASPSAFSVEFAEYTTENGYGAVQSVSIPYSSTSPALYSLQSAGIVEKAQWDVIFATTPEFSTELQTNFYMPTILFNSDAGVKVGFVDDSDINDITTVPSSMEWISDTSWEHPFGNMGTHQVLVYHPEPPYNHQVIVEVPNRVYIIDTPSGYYKLQFEEYSSGIVVFSYAVL
jgi:hypothetical protein